MAMGTLREKVMVLCYWNCCIKYGPDGVYYEGSVPKKIRVMRKTALSKLLDGLCSIIGFDKQKSKFKIFGRYPVLVSSDLITYVHFPLVNDNSLETMLELPSNHPSIDSVELYLEVKSSSNDVNDPAACSTPLENPGSSSKRQRIQQPQEATGYVDTNVTHPSVKLERDHGLDDNNGWVEDEADAGFSHGDGDREMTDKNSGSDGVAQGVNLTASNSNAQKDLNVPGLEASANACLINGVDSSASNPKSLSRLWVDDHELRVGLCFKDRDDLKKVVDWCSIRGQQKCVVRETEKDVYTFECVRWKCKWSLQAARMEEHGLVEITKCHGPHTCCPIRPENFDLEFVAEEIECLIRVQPTLTISELTTWWFDKYGDMLETSEMQAAKLEVIKKVFGEWDKSFSVLPKLMAAFQSSNELLVDWQYDFFPNPEFASFRGVFWAFPQSIEGFRHCRSLIIVDTKDLNGKYPMKLMIASGVEADDCYFPLAFAVTTEVSSDSWCWFLTEIREKVTQRKDICLISSPHPDILAAINKPESRWQEPWAYHRFCLDYLCSHFHDVFQDDYLKNLVDEAGSTSDKEEFDSCMKDIEIKNSEAWKWLDQFPQNQWALAHDSGRRYGFMIIIKENLFANCESFQSLGLPVTAIALLLFDEMRSSFYTGLCDSSGRVKRGDMYTTPVMDQLEKLVTNSITHIIMPLEKGAFQVTDPLQKDEWIVRLSECTCTCGKFQLRKFPCLHALAVCEKLKINPLQYVDDCYSLERLYETYSATFSPVPEVSAWPEASGVPTLFPPVILPPPNLSGKRKKSDTSSMASSKTHRTEKEQSKSVPVEKPGKGKETDKTKVRPSDQELRNAIVDILKVVDFKMTRVTDILERLVGKFEIDFTSGKSSIEVMIANEASKLRGGDRG